MVRQIPVMQDSPVGDATFDVKLGDKNVNVSLTGDGMTIKYADGKEYEIDGKTGKITGSYQDQPDGKRVKIDPPKNPAAVYSDSLQALHKLESKDPHTHTVKDLEHAIKTQTAKPAVKAAHAP